MEGNAELSLWCRSLKVAALEKQLDGTIGPRHSTAIGSGNTWAGLPYGQWSGTRGEQEAKTLQRHIQCFRRDCLSSDEHLCPAGLIPHARVFPCNSVNNGGLKATLPFSAI